MDEIEILTKAINKAQENGWTGLISPTKSMLMVTYPIIIFSHDFAKAFWGEDSITINIKEGISAFPYLTSMIAWKYHLQQMVLESEPLKYLEKFL